MSDDKKSTIPDGQESSETNTRLSDAELEARYGNNWIDLNEIPVLTDWPDAPELAGLDEATYIGLIPSEETAQRIYDWCKENGVPRPVSTHALHVTMFWLNRATTQGWKGGRIKPIVILPEQTRVRYIQINHQNHLRVYLEGVRLSLRREAIRKRLNIGGMHELYFYMTLSYDIREWLGKGVYKIDFPLTFVRERNFEPYISRQELEWAGVV